MKPADCLPPDLQGPATTITPLTAGLSGADVYRVDAGGRSFVLKVPGDSEPADDWRRALAIQRLAADAGLAPRIVHVDETRRAVLTALVVDRSLPTFLRDPRTRDAALASLGRTVRRIHDLPLPADAPERSPREFLAQLWGGPLADFTVPDLVRDAVAQALAAAPVRERTVLGHNDLNPGNLLFDGEAIVVLDWAAAGVADALYDLATLAVFLCLDGDACARLLSAYEGHALVDLPARFAAMRRLVAALAGTMQLYVARQMQHPGSTDPESLALGDFYREMRTGTLKLGTAEGQWAFGMALLKESLAG